MPEVGLDKMSPSQREIQIKGASRALMPALRTSRFLPPLCAREVIETNASVDFPGDNSLSTEI